MNSSLSAFSYADLRVDQTHTFEVVITPELVDAFAELSGDKSPLHVDNDFAKETAFGQRVAHGMIAGMFFSQLIGMHLPGKHALYLKQDLRFHRPVFLNTKVQVRGTIIHMADAIRTITLRTELINSATREHLVDGEALVRLSA